MQDYVSTVAPSCDQRSFTVAAVLDRRVDALATLLAQVDGGFDSRAWRVHDVRVDQVADTGHFVASARFTAR